MVLFRVGRERKFEFGGEQDRTADLGVMNPML